MSSLRTAVELQLKERHGLDLIDWMQQQRMAGRSLQAIADDICDLTGGIPVSREFVRSLVR